MQRLLWAILQLARTGYPEDAAEQIASVVHTECERNDRRHVDPLTVIALMAAESSFSTHKVNRRTGATGLMQIAPVHWDYLDHPADAFAIRTNVQMGIAIFVACLHRCGLNTAKALSLYNGRGACRDSVFARKVMRLRAELEKFEKVAA